VNDSNQTGGADCNSLHIRGNQQRYQGYVNRPKFVLDRSRNGRPARIVGILDSGGRMPYLPRTSFAMVANCMFDVPS
jgi:hypothetical protein